MNVHFIPDFEGSDNITMIAYALLPGVDAKFDAIDEDACKFMTCPIVKDVRNTYTLILNISPNYPLSTINTRWVMSQNSATKCCFVNKFKIESGY
jgi:Niemann-Pick C2 protein